MILEIRMYTDKLMADCVKITLLTWQLFVQGLDFKLAATQLFSYSKAAVLESENSEDGIVAN